MKEEISAGNKDRTEGGLPQGLLLFTADDVQRIQSSRDKVAGILQERYGYTRLQAEQRIADFLRNAQTQLAGPKQPHPVIF